MLQPREEARPLNAIFKRNSQKLARILAAEPKLVNARRPSAPRDTCLAVAVSLSLLDCIDVLLSANANVHLANNDGQTALHLAQSDAAIKRLLEYNANVDVEDRSGAQPLHHIVKRGNALAVQLLVAAGADVNSPSREGLPIHLAARNDNVEVVQALLAAGADPTKLDQMGNNAVDFMCRGTCTVHTMPRFLAILQLFSASCHMRLQLDNYRIFTVDWDNSPIMELLIEKFGMDVHQRNNAHYLSAYFGMQFSVVAMLLRHGFDPNARSNNGRSLIGEIDKERGIRREMTKSLQALIVAGLELRAPAIRGAAETNLDVIIRCNWLPSMDLTLPPAEIRRRCAAALRTAKELQRPEKLL